MQTVEIEDIGACSHLRMYPIVVHKRNAAVLYPGIYRRIFFLTRNKTLAIVCEVCFEYEGDPNSLESARSPLDGQIQPPPR